MKLTLTEFGGIIPRSPDHKLPSQGATMAHDIKLRNGRIEPWREPCEFAPVPSGSVSFHTHGCCAIAWDSVVQPAEIAPDWGRFYISGRGGTVEAVELSCKCVPAYYTVGVPAPVSPLSVSAAETCSRDSDARSYVYTYINKWYEESAPSPVSDVLRVADGTAVTLAGMALPPDGYGIIGANIYRATSGFRQAKGTQQNKATGFLYLATVMFPVTGYVDTVPLAGLGQPLETEKVRPAPAGLQNVVSIDSAVRLAATRKNRVYMTENFQLHNWPVKYELTLDSTIVHMLQNNMKLFVTTDTSPYVIDVSNCDDTKCTPVADLDTPLPDIACGHQGSAIMTPFGLVYSSPLGVVLVSADAKWHLLTKQWFSRDDWAKVAPDTARFGFYEGFLFIVTDRVSFLLDIDGEPYGDLKGTELTTFSDSPVAMETSSTGQLMLLADGKIWNWNGSDSFRPYLWESRRLALGNGASGGQPYGQSWAPSSAKLGTSGTQFTLVDSRDEAVFTRHVIDETPFRLPRQGRHSWWKIRLQGTAPVEYVDLGMAYFTVNDGA